MEKKKGINIFEAAQSKPKAASKTKSKEIVSVKGLETKLLEFDFLKEELAETKTKLEAVTNEIKEVSKQKFIELYKEKKTNPNTFYIKDGEGCVMVIPMDSYIKIKEEDRAEELIDRYGEETITTNVRYYFNSDVLERNMDAIIKLIRDAKTISEDDKNKLLDKEVTYEIADGFIDRLLPYGKNMENVIDDVRPTIALKSCGGKMADGGISDENELIAFVYDDYDAEVGSSVSSMYAKGGMMGKHFVGKFNESQLRSGEDKKAIQKAMKETGYKYIDSNIIYKNGKPHMMEVYLYADGGMMADGGNISRYEIEQEKDGTWMISDKETGYYVDRWFETKKEAESYLWALTFKKRFFNDVDRAVIDRIKRMNGKEDISGYMATGGKVNWLDKVYSIRGFYSDGFEEDLGDTNDLSEAIEMANAGQMQTPEYVTVKVLEVFGQKNSDYGDYDEIEYYSTNDKKALGGIFGDSRYNSGRSWHLDRAKHNQKESYEKPLKYRKRRRYGDGGDM
jgi:hypothetical protein